MKPPSGKSDLSIAVAFSRPEDFSALLSTIEGGVAERRPDSVRVSIRGPRSRVVELLERVGDRATDVSATISLKGDVPQG